MARTDLRYEFYPRKERLELADFGSLVNYVSPVRIKTGGVLYNTANNAIQVDNEVEYYVVPGDILAHAGVRLSQQFGGTGYNRQTRVMGDFGSRMYLIVAARS